MIAILADIHGNYPALKNVLKVIDGLGVDSIISLGDIAGYYPFINECIDMLRERNVVNLMGNHDYYLVAGLKCPRSNSVNELATIQRQKIRPDNFTWLASSQTCFIQDDILMVHGGLSNPIDEYLLKIRSTYFECSLKRFFFSGHTHVQSKLELGHGQYYCNPGSVGQPRDGNPKAAFALFDRGGIELCRVKYDIDQVTSSLQTYGFASYYSENLYKGTRIGGKVDKIELVSCQV